VRVLLDENLPHDLAQALAEHEVVTVQGLGWSGLENGELLRRADGHIDAFVTAEGPHAAAHLPHCGVCRGSGTAADTASTPAILFRACSTRDHKALHGTKANDAPNLYKRKGQ